eukprot:6408245-Alexandrium_andersonii.AAC.1
MRSWPSDVFSGKALFAWASLCLGLSVIMPMPLAWPRSGGAMLPAIVPTTLPKTINKARPCPQQI